MSKRSILFMGLIFCMLCMGGCQKETQEVVREEKKEIQIPVIFTVDTSTGIKNEQAVVEAFNEEYKGKYHLDVEWVMETEEEYRQNLKRLNVTDELPAVLTDLRMLPSFYQMMISNGRIEDLSPYIMEDEEWLSMIEPVVLSDCTETDGKIYLSPVSTAAFSCSGVFWNEELFRQAGIDKFPETWEEFWICCDTLKACGITPLALHTEGTGWATMLFATAALADTESGASFMEQFYPDTYQNDSGLQLAEITQKLFQYTTEDAIHSDFDVSYTNFITGKAAMIPNGYWMIDQIPEEFTENVRFSAFPGNKLISSPESFGWSVVSGYDEEVKRGAVEFLKFRTKLNKEEKEALFSKTTEETGQLVKDYIKAYNNRPQIVPNYQVKWNSILQEETLGEALSDLATGKITKEVFLEKLDQSIRQFEEEQ